MVTGNGAFAASDLHRKSATKITTDGVGRRMGGVIEQNMRAATARQSENTRTVWGGRKSGFERSIKLTVGTYEPPGNACYLGLRRLVAAFLPADLSAVRPSFVTEGEATSRVAEG